MVSSSTQGHESNLKNTQTLAKTMIPKRYRSPINKFVTMAADFTLEHWKRIWILSFWLMLNIGLFTWKFIEFRRKTAYEVMGYCVSVAKGSAETLKLNMALILFPVCRNTITRLRSTALSRIIPFDDNINFHKVINYLIQPIFR